LYIFKILITGDASVGKTTLTHRLISGQFEVDFKPSIGTTMYSKKINYEGQEITLVLWDFAGEDKFRFLLKSYAEGADGAFLLYDITNFNSFNNIKNWNEVIREAEENIPIMLIGSKLDLENSREVPREEGEEAAKKFDLYPFIELSSKSGENVDRAFDDLVEMLITFIRHKEKKTPFTI